MLTRILICRLCLTSKTYSSFAHRRGTNVPRAHAGAPASVAATGSNLKSRMELWQVSLLHCIFTIIWFIFLYYTGHIGESRRRCYLNAISILGFWVSSWASFLQCFYTGLLSWASFLYCVVFDMSLVGIQGYTMLTPVSVFFFVWDFWSKLPYLFFTKLPLSGPFGATLNSLVATNIGDLWNDGGKARAQLLKQSCQLRSSCTLCKNFTCNVVIACGKHTVIVIARLVVHVWPEMWDLARGVGSMPSVICDNINAFCRL